MKRLLSLLGFIFILSSCQKLPDVQVPQIESPIALDVSLESDTLITNALVALELKVRDGVPNELELLLDNAPLNTFALNPTSNQKTDYKFIWDSRKSSEGVHHLKAVAYGAEQVFRSQELSIVVDRSAPQVLELSPNPDKPLINIPEVIEILFSEPLTEASMTNETISLTNMAGLVIPTVFSCEGEKLTLQLLEPLTLPSNLKLELAVKDLAGNELRETWVWTLSRTYPAKGFRLLEPTTPVAAWDMTERPVRIVADQADHMAVVWLDDTQLKVQVRTEADWLLLPEPSHKTPIFRPAIALMPSGKPVIAWQEATSSSQADIRVMVWNDPVWSDLGRVNTSGFDAAAPSIAVSATGEIFVAWLEYDGQSQNVSVKRWNGSSWEPVGKSLDINFAQNAAFPDLFLDSQGQPYVAWREDRAEDFAWTIYVKRWDGFSWQQLGEGLNYNAYERADMPSIALNEHDQPYVVWSEYDPTSHSNNIYLKVWDGSSWQALGDAVEEDVSERSIYPTIALGKYHELSVSWWGYTLEKQEVIRFAQWSNDAWQYQAALNEKENAQAFYPSMSLSGIGQSPVIAWLERKPDEGSAIIIKQAY